jgi:hypothetical protein
MKLILVVVGFIASVVSSNRYNNAILFTAVLNRVQILPNIAKAKARTIESSKFNS